MIIGKIDCFLATISFTDPVFSGQPIMARSQAQSLLMQNESFTHTKPDFMANWTYGTTIVYVLTLFKERICNPLYLRLLYYFCIQILNMNQSNNIRIIQSVSQTDMMRKFVKILSLVSFVSFKVENGILSQSNCVGRMTLSNDIAVVSSL